jgi:hypothetical protein
MRTLLALLGIAALVVLAGMMTGYIKLDQTQTAQLPRLEGGQAPKFEASVAKVDVGTVNRTVEVPKVDVQKPQ